jgi:hypothetical protein
MWSVPASAACVDSPGRRTAVSIPVKLVLTAGLLGCCSRLQAR